MAKIRINSLSPDALPQQRGRVSIQMRANGPVATRWPRKRPGEKTPSQTWAMQMFASASYLASKAGHLDYETAKFLCRGTTNVPRDLLTAAALGTLYVIRNLDGTEWKNGNHPYVPPSEPVVENEDMAIIWPFLAQGTPSYSTSSSAYKWKGNILVPKDNITISKIMANVSPLTGSKIDFAIGICDGLGIILSIEHQGSVVMSSTYRSVVSIDYDTTLTAGDKYFVVASVNGSSPTYAMPITLQTNSQYNVPIDYCVWTRAAVADLEVGTQLEIGQTFAPNHIGFVATKIEPVEDWT